jgi:multidrug resistance efflux pump
MPAKRIRVPLILLLVIGLFVGAYFGIRALTQKETSGLSLSGTIEGEEINVAAESSGKVLEVFAVEGSAVKTGDPLFRLDDTLLQAQRKAAAASVDLSQSALANAQAQFDVIDAGVQLDAVNATTALLTAPDPSGYTLPNGYYSQQELSSAAATELANAQAALDKAQNDLKLKLAEQNSTDFKAAEIALMRERAALLNAENTLAKARLSQNQDFIDAAQAQVDDTRENLDIAQTTYDGLKDTEPARAIISLRAQVALMSESLTLAREAFIRLQIGEDSPKWQAADAALRQAKAAVEQANAQLALIDTQIGKLTIYAPADGTLAEVIVKPGEVITAGASGVTIEKPDSLSITVYVPEDLIGSIQMDQKAALTVDSFPGVIFEAHVIQIASQAEFTPRNTSTTEGRKTTVFAVKLAVDNPNGKLKSGMPADIVFDKGIQ